MIRPIQASFPFIILAHAVVAWAEPPAAPIEAVAARGESYVAAFNRRDESGLAPQRGTSN